MLHTEDEMSITRCSFLGKHVGPMSYRVLGVEDMRRERIHVAHPWIDSQGSIVDCGVAGLLERRLQGALANETSPSRQVFGASLI